MSGITAIKFNLLEGLGAKPIGFQADTAKDLIAAFPEAPGPLLLISHRWCGRWRPLGAATTRAGAALTMKAVTELPPTQELAFGPYRAEEASL